MICFRKIEEFRGSVSLKEIRRALRTSLGEIRRVLRTSLREIRRVPGTSLREIRRVPRTRLRLNEIRRVKGSKLREISKFSFAKYIYPANRDRKKVHTVHILRTNNRET